MKVIKITNKIRCELGVCNNLATYALTMSRTGIRSRIYLCEECLRRIYAEAKAILDEKTAATESEKTAATESKKTAATEPEKKTEKPPENQPKPKKQKIKKEDSDEPN